MDADYGGTEIRNALNAVFKSSNKRTPVAAFVLTDGEVRQTNARLSCRKLNGRLGARHWSNHKRSANSCEQRSV